jgi:hypothetical protein
MVNVSRHQGEDWRIDGGVEVPQCVHLPFHDGLV